MFKSFMRDGRDVQVAEYARNRAVDGLKGSDRS